ncbi:MAG: glycoside hydrolase, family 38 [Acidimicrobiales bacterium]|nr:glycoside hydrolase, family 38 [Acidimicrobiales bacterium]
MEPRKGLRCVLVSHTHWDREWYRTFESFRGRLVDAVDRVLDLLGEDPGWHFVLDGQSIVLEDYLDVRPDRRAELVGACHSGRVGVGPWYVQPDSLLPGGETHVRNLLEGRRVASEFGSASTVAYTPDSFGHPAQFPQILAGFGLDAFVYWRGNGSEIDTLGPTYEWEAPDGSVIPACLLAKGYFGASALPGDVQEAVERLTVLGEQLAEGDGDAVVFMNGVDHALPDANTGEVCDALAAATGWSVRRGLLEDYVEAALDGRRLARFSGELVGARLTIVLPGVWSSRMALKLRNRRAETALVGWAEPWAALGSRYGTPDERPALRLAWRALLENQAHDSICGCSIDEVHEQMQGRFDTAEGLAESTTARVLEQLAGLGPERRTAWSEQCDVAVFNPCPYPRTDVVRIPLDGFPPVRQAGDGADLHPSILAGLVHSGFTVDGQPARIVASQDPTRFQAITNAAPIDLEVVVVDVPAFGWRRVAIAPSNEAVPDAVDDGRQINAGDVAVVAAADGTLTVKLGARQWSGLAAVEDCGDRGDSYDADPVGPLVTDPTAVSVERRRHASGIQTLRVTRAFAIPVSLGADREGRADTTTTCTVTTEVRVAPGVERIDLCMTIDNAADDHRLRLVFPTGAAVEEFRAATTFDVATRSTTPPNDEHWVHPAPTTFPHQGWVAVNGLLVGSPGLPEAAVTPDGTIKVTVLRAVGWLSRGDLRTRPVQAGPGMPAPGAQCHGRLVARLVLATDADPSIAHDAELGLRAVPAGDAPLLEPGVSILELAPRGLTLSAVKPAGDGRGLIVRVLNPTDESLEAHLRLAGATPSVSAVRLDETPSSDSIRIVDGSVNFAVPPHALRSVLVR